jgi:hypothetical protein
MAENPLAAGGLVIVMLIAYFVHLSKRHSSPSKYEHASPHHSFSTKWSSTRNPINWMRSAIARRLTLLKKGMLTTPDFLYRCRIVER